MKLTTGRLFFVLLGLVAIILLGVMIGLQLLIILNQDQPTAVNEGGSAQEQVTPAPTLLSATTAPLPTDTPLPPTEMPLPTATPILPTAAPPTFTPVPPVDTPLPAATPLPATAPPIPPTLPPASPTATLILPTAAPPTAAIAAAVPATATPAAPVPTDTAEASADLRFGYTERSPGCTFVTEIVQLALTRQMGLHVAIVHFQTTDDLFTALSATTGKTRVDLTFCYVDPDDRTLLANYGSSLRFLDSYYGESNKKKLYAVINSALIGPLKSARPCVHNFLKQLDFGDLQFQEKDPTQWLDNHQDRIAAWSQCP